VGYDATTHQLFSAVGLTPHIFTVVVMSEELPGAPLKCTVSPAVLSILTQRVILYHTHDTK